MRHGQSVWNAENRFTGWMDIPLTPSGERDAIAAGRLLRAHGLTFDIAFTSVLQRAIKTLHLVLEELGRLWIPVTCAWELNERHDGAATGLNKKQLAQQFGADAVRAWRRGYSAAPPPLAEDHPCWPGHDPKYSPPPCPP